MSGSEKNILNITDVHAALIRGDIPSVLGHLSDTVDWQSPATSASIREIPWSKPRQTRSQVESFLKEVFRKVRYDKFETVSVLAQGDNVVVEGTVYGTVVSAARPFRSDFVMMFTFQDGKVIRFRHYYDSADLTSAYNPRNKERFSDKTRLKYVKLF